MDFWGVSQKGTPLFSSRLHFAPRIGPFAHGKLSHLSRFLLLTIPVSFQPRPESGAFSHQSAWYCGIILLHQKDRRTKGESDTDVRV